MIGRSHRARLASALILTGALGISSIARAADELARVAYLAQDSGYWQAWVMGADGSGARSATSSPVDKARVAWFPDGSSVLVTTAEGKLVRVDLATNQEQPIRTKTAGTLDAVPSPDGDTIAFSLSPASSPDDNDIWTVSAQGEKPRRLTNMPRVQHDPAWSSDGRWIYFSSRDGNDAHQIWRVARDGSTREAVTSGRGYHFDAGVSPTGQLAFSGNPDGDYEIYLVEKEGAQPRRLTESPGLDGAPCFGAGGRSLIFHSTRSGIQNLWTLDLESGSSRRLTDHAEGARSPACWEPR